MELEVSEYQDSVKTLKDVLGLTHEPVAVKFFEKRIDLDDFQIPSQRRYCQLLMGARKGKRLIASADNVSCPAAAWALGIKEPPSKLTSGEMPAQMGIFGSAAAARNTFRTMPRLEMDKYEMVAYCPLADVPFEPDWDAMAAARRPISKIVNA